MLRASAKKVALLANLGPVNFVTEVARLDAAYAAAGGGTPRFEYRPPPDLGGVALGLEGLADRLERLSPVGSLYAARAREIALEAEIVAARGAPFIRELSQLRFGTESCPAELGLAADELADRWLQDTRQGDPDEPASIVTDDPAEPRSLVCRMREEIGRRRLAVRVVVSSSIAPLAAAGDGVVHVAAGRRVTEADVERTVVHELDGHIVPGIRASSSPFGLLSIGSARGSDGQEGYALALERRGGHLRRMRRIELATRHLAARLAHAGASFGDVVLCGLGRGAPREVAVRAACRVFRGGGLGREAAYLPALIEVERALEARPAIEAILGAGRLSVEAAVALGEIAR